MKQGNKASTYPFFSLDIITCESSHHAVTKFKLASLRGTTWKTHTQRSRNFQPPASINHQVWVSEPSASSSSSAQIFQLRSQVSGSKGKLLQWQHIPVPKPRFMSVINGALTPLNGRAVCFATIVTGRGPLLHLETDKEVSVDKGKILCEREFYISMVWLGSKE